MAITKQRIAKMIQEQLSCGTGESRELLNILIEELKLCLEEGDEVKISGFGKWIVRDKKKRVGRNPHTGENLIIPPRRVVLFHPSVKLRATLNPHITSVPYDDENE